MEISIHAKFWGNPYVLEKSLCFGEIPMFWGNPNNYLKCRRICIYTSTNFLMKYSKSTRSIPLLKMVLSNCCNDITSSYGNWQACKFFNKLHLKCRRSCVSRLFSWDKKKPLGNQYSSPPLLRTRLL